MRKTKGADTLTLKEQTFVEHYVKSGNAVASATAAGWAQSTAVKSASLILKRPRVAQEIEKIQAQLRQDTRYGLEQAHEETCRRLDAAERANQHSAVASLMKIKLTLHGLLIERAVNLVEKIDLRKAIEEGRRRVASLYAPTIDITPEPKTETAAPADVIFGD